MKKSTERIHTSHAGSLPRPDDLIELNRARLAEGFGDDEAFQERLRAAVMDVVTRQQNLDIDIPGDGEYGKAMGHRVNYGAWWSYSFQRLGGLELTGPGLYEMPAHRSEPGHIVLTSFGDRRDRRRFAEAYADPESGITTGPRPRNWPVCTGPVTYIGQAAIQSDIANFKVALAAVGASVAVCTRRSPGPNWRRSCATLNSPPNSWGEERTRVDNPALSTRPCDDAMSIPVQ